MAVASQEGRPVGALERQRVAGGCRIGGGLRLDLRRRRGGGDGERHGGAQEGEPVPDAEPSVDRRAARHRLRDPDAGRPVGDRRHQRDRQSLPDRKREPDRHADRRLPYRRHDSGEREDTECEDERGEAEAQQDAVEASGDRHRHHPPPVLGKLAADLGMIAVPRSSASAAARASAAASA